MTTLFDNTDVTVEMAFGAQPLATSPTWTDVSAYVRRVSINRGRSSELTRYSAGSARIELDNRDRRFDPEHTSSPYAGDLVPMVQVRVTSQYSTGTVNTIYRGFILGWPTAYNSSNTDAVTTVQCVDGTRLFANLVLPQSSYISEVINPTYPFFSGKPIHYWPLQTAEYVQYDEINDVPLEFWNPFGNSSISLNKMDIPLDAPNTVNTAGMTNDSDEPPWPLQGMSAYQDWSDGTSAPDWTVYKDTSNYWVIKTMPSVNKISLAYFNSDLNHYLAPNVGGIWYEFAHSTWRPLVNRIDAFIESGYMKVFINGTNVANLALTTGTSSGATGYPYFGTEGPNSHCAVYDYNSPLTANGVFWLNKIGADALDGQNAFERLIQIGYGIGWPAPLSAFPFGYGDQPLGQYLPQGRRATDYIETINNAEQGNIFFSREDILTFIDRTRTNISVPEFFFSTEAGDLPFQDVTVDGNSADAVTNKVIARFANGERTALNQTSIDDYGLSTLVIDAELISDPTTAQQIAQRRVDLASTPRTRLTQLKVDVRKDASTLVDAMSTIDLADDVVVFFTPTNVGDDIWRSVRVQGISHDITPESWTSSMYLAPGTTGQNGPLFILNDSRWGELNDGNRLG